MFSYTDNNYKIIYPWVTILSISLFFSSGVAYHHHENILAVVLQLMNVFQVVFLLSLSYEYRIDYTGYTKVWKFKNKILHIPINKIDIVEYQKRLHGGWSRKALLSIKYGEHEELVLLQKRRGQHYELVRLLNGCGVTVEFVVFLWYQSRPATQNEIDKMFLY